MYVGNLSNDYEIASSLTDWIVIRPFQVQIDIDELMIELTDKNQEFHIQQ